MSKISWFRNRPKRSVSFESVVSRIGTGSVFMTRVTSIVICKKLSKVNDRKELLVCNCEIVIESFVMSGASFYSITGSRFRAISFLMLNFSLSSLELRYVVFAIELCIHLVCCHFYQCDQREERTHCKNDS